MSKTIQFNSLEEAFECYGRDNLIPIDFIKQIIFYTSKGVQPRFIYENENKPGKLTAWFLKSETQFVMEQWRKTKPIK